MADIRILTEAELRSHIQLNLAAIECVEQAFHALATRAVIMPPIMRLDIVEHNGEIDVKTAYIPGVDSLAIKISPGFFDNPKLGPRKPATGFSFATYPAADTLMIMTKPTIRKGNRNKLSIPPILCRFLRRLRIDQSWNSRRTTHATAVKA